MCSHRFNSSSMMMTLLVNSLILAIILSSNLAESRFTVDNFATLSESSTTNKAHGGKGKGQGGAAATAANGTNWAVLVAGSNGYGNYRHQADICHAYQILKKGGLKDENIIVFMYDDIAHNPENPRKGVIINSPHGPNVYKGVPKDYTGENVTASNLIGVILGDKRKVKSGSRKVVKSGPKDNIFIYYADHGSTGLLGMPAGEDLYAHELVDALKKKQAAKSYNRMVIYIEACESGSVVDGLLPEGMNVYVTTASNTSESSFATYCKDMDPTVPPEYDTCLGDLYSVAWMEDSEKHDPETETLGAQYQVVKKRTIAGKEFGSHVMQYGDSKVISKDVLGLYLGYSARRHSSNSDRPDAPLVAVDQREADILYLRQKVRKAPEGSEQKAAAERELEEALAHRKHVDESIERIGRSLFRGGVEEVMRVRPAGQPLVDDWECLKSMVRVYKAHCGSLETYGMKYMRAFANVCNAGVDEDRMAQVSSQACKA
ncbi:hypothetical protein V2J09_022929 [Rumex salicifolius]